MVKTVEINPKADIILIYNNFLFHHCLGVINVSNYIERRPRPSTLDISSADFLLLSATWYYRS